MGYIYGCIPAFSAQYASVIVVESDKYWTLTGLVVYNDGFNYQQAPNGAQLEKVRWHK